MLFQITIHGEASIDWVWDSWDFYETYFIEARDPAEAGSKAKRLLTSRRRTYHDAGRALTFNRVEVRTIRSLSDLEKHVIEPGCELTWARPSPSTPQKGKTA